MTSVALQSRNRRTGMVMLAVAAAMLALGYAAVPLYRLFCQVTGFGGTTQRVTEAEAVSAETHSRSAAGKMISIRFDANTARDMPWQFKPLQVTDKVQIGVRDMAIFTARNLSDLPVTGTATFNVEPEQAGKYFNKVQCFCFTEQTLKPGQEVRMPVVYFIDPKALDDPNMQDVEQVTLSYTFHKVSNQPS